MEHKLIIAFIGAAGTGRTTLARMLAGYHCGNYYSVHESLRCLIQEQYGDIPTEREQFTLCANKLRRKKRDSALAIRTIVSNIKAQLHTAPRLHVIESIQCLGEMAYLEKQFAKTATVIFIGLRSMPGQRLEWINQSPEFEKVSDSPAMLIAKEWRTEALAGRYDANTQACLDTLPEDHIFDNEGDGHATELYKGIEKIIPWQK